MIEFSIAKCKSKAAFSAKLRQRASLDLAKIKKKFEIILDTPILLVIKVKDVEIIVHGHGELLFKQSAPMDILEEIAKEVYAVGLP